jgi:surfactin synthase thioesterase subunit
VGVDVAQRSELWIRRFHQAAPGAPALACFPHAGGSASFYHPVSAALSPAIEVLPVQYPGRQDRRLEPPVRSIHELADLVAPVLARSGDRPLALFGHSMGGILAFEVACRLERQMGIRPVALFASGRRAPSRVRYEDVHLRDDDQVIAEIRRLGGTDSSLLEDDTMRDFIMPALRGDYTAIETYRMRTDTKLSCPVVVLVGDSDPQVTAAEADAWREHTTGQVDVHTFPGGHFYLLDHAAAVLKIVEETLAA